MTTVRDRFASAYQAARAHWKHTPGSRWETVLIDHMVRAHEAEVRARYGDEYEEGHSDLWLSIPKEQREAAIKRLGDVALRIVAEFVVECEARRLLQKERKDDAADQKT